MDHLLLLTLRSPAATPPLSHATALPIQDTGFVTVAQSAMLTSVPWYKERLLGTVSVGSLMVIVLVRTVRTNLAGAHDAYVHTNCLAALANIAPLLRKLHPHAARSLVSLYDLFARKFLKMSRKQQKSAELTDQGAGGSRAVVPSADSVEVSGRSEADEAPSDETLQMAVDFLRISLEALNLCLTAGPALNEHLVYALLERQTIFATLREHEVRLAELLGL